MLSLLGLGSKALALEGIGDTDWSGWVKSQYRRSINKRAAANVRPAGPAEQHECPLSWTLHKFSH